MVCSLCFKGRKPTPRLRPESTLILHSGCTGAAATSRMVTRGQAYTLVWEGNWFVEPALRHPKYSGCSIAEKGIRPQRLLPDMFQDRQAREATCRLASQRILKRLSPLSNSDKSKPSDSSSAWSRWRLHLPKCSRRRRCWSSFERCTAGLWTNITEVCNAVVQADQLHLCCHVDQTLSFDVVSSFAWQ